MKQTIETVINLMAASAITAPKAGGKDCLEIVALTEAEDLQRIADEMRKYAHNSTKENYWHRDASNTENAQGLLLIGLAGPVTTVVAAAIPPVMSLRKSVKSEITRWAIPAPIASCA